MDPGQPPLVTFVCLLTAVVTLAFMARQFFGRTHDLLSYRNLFLLGFVHFQALSGFLSGLTGEPWRGQPFRSSTYYIFAVGLVLFAALFFWSYQRVKLARFVGHLFPSRSAPPTPGWIITGIVLSLVVGVASIAVVQTGHSFVSALAGQMVFGAFVFAIVLCTYLWVQSPANPFYMTLLVVLPPITIFLSTVGAHGRREMVGVLLGIIWGIYMFRWRYQQPRRTLLRFAVIGAMAFVVLMGYTAVRGVQKGRWGVEDTDVATVAKLRWQGLGRANMITQGLIPIVFTDCANCSLVTIDRWGNDEAKPHQPFFSIYYFLVNPVPRDWWPDKPVAMGKTLPLSLNRTEFNQITFGPGVIGHGWHEMGIFGIAYYGIIFGLLTRAMDDKLTRQARNPFFVAAAGSLLGHAVGMARGDIGVFMVNAVGALIVPFGILLTLGMLSGGGGREAAEAELEEMEAGGLWDEDYDDAELSFDEFAEYADDELEQAHQDEPVA
jgi:hypothetical protein